MTGTDDLLARLAAEPPPPALRPGRLGLAIVALTAAAAAVFLGLAGARPGLFAALADPVVLAKTLWPALIAALALPPALRSLRPGGLRPGAAALWLALAAGLALWLLGYQTRPAAARFAEFTPGFIAECLGLILTIAALPLAAALALLRRGASTRPVRTGALAGLGVGGVAATGYSLFCVQDNPVFYVVWYGAALLVLAAAGALAGRRVLAW